MGGGSVQIAFEVPQSVRFEPQVTIHFVKSNVIAVTTSICWLSSHFLSLYVGCRVCRKACRLDIKLQIKNLQKPETLSETNFLGGGKI